MVTAEALRALQERIAAQARLPVRAQDVALRVAGLPCGALPLALARRIASALPAFRLEGDAALALDEDVAPGAPQRSACLDALARHLLAWGVSPAWRGENLDVRADPQGPALACIDRSAVRVLGITTYSVHLNGHTHDGRLVVARRAAHKRVDPGMWDNLTGGMIAAGESPREALVREADEEAGLDMARLAVSEGARLHVRRAIGDGVLDELVHVFDVDLPPGTAILNRDGEVESFATWTVPQVCAAIEQDRFTVEAALATLESLARRAARTAPRA